MVHGGLCLTVCGCACFQLICIWTCMLAAMCTVSVPYMSPSLCVCIVVVLQLRGDKSLILGGLLRAMTSDASQSNNIQGVEFYNNPSLLVLKQSEHCSAHFHTYCLFCLLWMHLYQDPSRKESVFFKTYLTVVNTAEMPL